MGPERRFRIQQAVAKKVLVQFMKTSDERVPFEKCCDPNGMLTYATYAFGPLQSAGPVISVSINGGKPLNMVLSETDHWDKFWVALMADPCWRRQVQAQGQERVWQCGLSIFPIKW